MTGKAAFLGRSARSLFDPRGENRNTFDFGGFMRD